MKSLYAKLFGSYFETVKLQIDTIQFGLRICKIFNYIQFNRYHKFKNSLFTQFVAEYWKMISEQGLKDGEARQRLQGVIKDSDFVKAAPEFIKEIAVMAVVVVAHSGKPESDEDVQSQLANFIDDVWKVCNAAPEVEEKNKNVF